jgi:hypothetical protein
MSRALMGAIVPKKQSNRKRIQAPPRPGETDVVVADEATIRATQATGADRLSFDGYTLTWHGSAPSSFTGFSGRADESAKESVKEEGPTPQGVYAVDPAAIQYLQPSVDWGSHRVRLDPYKATVDRMTTCFGLVRTGLYIHGGSVTGTHGCIELNDDADENAFFKKLKQYGRKIELEVKYAGAREKKYEEPKCPV